MMQLEHIIGDVVCLVLRNSDSLKELNLVGPMIHLKIRGYDKMGLWIEHPGLVIVKTEDSAGKAIPLKKQIKESVDASVLITWDNIQSIMHYPNREGYDFPSEFDRTLGFKVGFKEE